MSRKVHNLLWLPAIALSGGAQALGLGELHVTSALNEPLAGQIDIVGATPEELSNIRAAIANRDTFQRYGADRPAFLGTANFKVGQDKFGRPVLLVRSTDAFTEPLVSLLVDLRWSTGELVREYTLLLDPAISASSASRVPEPASDLPGEEPARVAAAPFTSGPLPHRLAAAPPSAPRPSAPLPGTPTSGGALYVVARRDTLGAVARRNGAKTESELLKTMVAIFHANPDAFSGNINRLRVGAILTIPSSAVIAAIPERAASLEVHAQMLAWHAAAGSLVAMAQTGPTRATPAASAAAVSARGADAETIKELTDRIDALQQGLAELKRQEELHGAAAPVSAPSPAVPVASAAPTSAPSPWITAPPPVNSEPTPVAEANAETSPGVAADAAPIGAQTAGDAPAAKQSHGGLIAGAFVLLAAAVGFAYRRYRRRADDESDDAFGTEPVDRYASFKPSPGSQPQSEQPEREVPAPVEAEPIYRLPPRAQILSDDDAGVETILEGDTARCRVITPEEIVAEDSTAEETAEHEQVGETTVTVALTAVTAYDPTLELPRRDEVEFESPSMDLENSETHVNMPSGLHDQVAFKERRVNAVDVLRSAIERDPERIDLRVKLMELYHATAAINRQGFLDAARRLAQQPNYQATAEWEKIAAMGRQIAPEDPLFALDPTVQHVKLDEKLADCA